MKQIKQMVHGHSSVPMCVPILLVLTRRRSHWRSCDIVMDGRDGEETRGAGKV
jgi:hypothetical protein